MATGSINWITKSIPSAAEAFAIVASVTLVSVGSRRRCTTEVVTKGRYLEPTREVLREYGGLWFFDESYVISRRQH